MPGRMMECSGLICPACGTGLETCETADSCPNCKRVFPIKEGIHNLLPQTLANSSLGEIKSAEDPTGGWWRPGEALKLHQSEFLDFADNILGKCHFSGKVLEIGAGVGWASSMLKAQNPNISVYASDIAYANLELGKSYFPVLGGYPDVLVACDAQQLPFENDFFDAVFCCSTLHHFPDVAKGLSEIRRVLKSKGTFLAIGESTAIPFMKFVYRIVMERTGTRRKGVKEYKIKEGLYSLPEWKSFFRTAGFNHFDYEPRTEPKYWRSFGSRYHQLYYGFANKLPRSLVIRIGSMAKFVAVK